jgi:Protein of unknown function (DUF3124)
MNNQGNLFWSGIVLLTLALLVFAYLGNLPQTTHAPGVVMPTGVAGGASGVVRDAAPASVKSAYVPAYSNVQAASGLTQIDLATTLSIHNTSRERPLVVQRIAYFDTQGQLVQEYLREPVSIPPLGTTQAFVAAEDRRGGAGANFIVDWTAEPVASEPVVEAVMIGSVGTTSYSFVTRGQLSQIVAVQ